MRSQDDDRHVAVRPVNTRIVILTKEPIQGTVKTRLIPTIGPEKATALHTALAWETIERAQKTELPVHVSLAGNMDSPFANRLRTRGISVEEQIKGDLGQRMAHALRSPGKAIALGTDCVVFEPEWLKMATSTTAPVMIGPADDGGYWLIGVQSDHREIIPAIFHDMKWSTSSVCADTASRLHALKKNIHWLPKAYDIDTIEDLKRLHNDPKCPHRVRLILETISLSAH